MAESEESYEIEFIIKNTAWQVFEELRTNGQLCDAIIKCNDGQFPVHRVIMSGCSPYFRALFTKGFNETDQREIFLQGINSDMMKCIIQYAYSGAVEINTENADSLFIIADQYNVIGLVKLCASFYRDNLAVDNCVGIYFFAKAHFFSTLCQEAQEFIFENFREIAKESNEILGLSREALEELLKSDDLNVKNEENVFELIVRWVKHNESERIVHIADMMKCVRMGLISTAYFVDSIKNHPYVNGNQACRPLVIEAFKFLCELDCSHKEVDPTHPLARPRIPHEVIFAVGGWSGGSPTNVIESYDTRADRWLLFDSVEIGARAYHGCATIDDDVYIIGGFDGVEYYNSCHCFNVTKKEWHEISSMNSKRCYVSVTVLEGIIYSLGGYDGHVRQNTAERYNPEDNQWRLIEPMNFQRSDASACATGGKVYICGGFNGQECLNTAESYDPVTNQWTLLPEMHNRRSGIGVISLDGYVYAVGGFNGITRLNNAERYDPATRRWRSIADMSTPRSNFGIEVIDEMVFAVGGFNGITTIENVECYDPSANEWYDCTDMMLLRSALSCCVVRGLAHVRDFISREN